MLDFYQRMCPVWSSTSFHNFPTLELACNLFLQQAVLNFNGNSPHDAIQHAQNRSRFIQQDAMTEARIDVFRGVAKDSEVEAELCPTMVARTVACHELDTLGPGTYHHCLIFVESL